MQRLAKPSDYVRQEVLGRATFVLPWEPRLCPGNPADDPEIGAQLYNEFACAAAKGVIGVWGAMEPKTNVSTN
ncbi:hypothetical protein [Pseudomonas lactis]|uniref:hypothetical protein n=1 Tax=Pseudomonas lactis TaxID=1615674 RepID=UPI00110C8162|nr:hypothetical protein [Pseudomonas lactis]